MIYILQSNVPLNNGKRDASYYIGYADDDKFMQRINKHMKGRGSNFTKECIRRGGNLMLVALFEGDRNDERICKNRKSTAAIVHMLQRGKKPSCIRGDVLFCQPKNWLEESAHTLPIFQI